MLIKDENEIKKARIFPVLFLLLLFLICDFMCACCVWYLLKGWGMYDLSRNSGKSIDDEVRNKTKNEKQIPLSSYIIWVADSIYFWIFFLSLFFFKLMISFFFFFRCLHLFCRDCILGNKKERNSVRERGREREWADYYFFLLCVGIIKIKMFGFFFYDFVSKYKLSFVVYATEKKYALTFRSLSPPSSLRRGIFIPNILFAFFFF